MSLTVVIRYLLVYPFLIGSIGGCSSPLRLNQDKIRTWKSELSQEYPHEKSVIAHYKKQNYALFYLAAEHANNLNHSTLRLVEHLFKSFDFNVVLIESIPYSSGESPKWFVEEAEKGRTEDFIRGGESALAAIHAHNKNIPFFAGEADHKDFYLALRKLGFKDIDVVGFYVVRQIPQWVREGEVVESLLDRKVPPFLIHYCRLFSILTCPSQSQVSAWYKIALGKELKFDVSNEETAPLAESQVITHRISSEIGFIRDHFTLNLIEKMLERYKKVAVIYGAGHFFTLRHSFDDFFGPPHFTEAK